MIGFVNRSNEKIELASDQSFHEPERLEKLASASKKQIIIFTC